MNIGWYTSQKGITTIVLVQEGDRDKDDLRVWEMENEIAIELLRGTGTIAEHLFKQLIEENDFERIELQKSILMIFTYFFKPREGPKLFLTDLIQ